MTVTEIQERNGKVNVIGKVGQVTAKLPGRQPSSRERQQNDVSLDYRNRKETGLDSPVDVRLRKTSTVR